MKTRNVSFHQAVLKPMVEELVKLHRYGFYWFHEGQRYHTFVRTISFPVDAVQRPELVDIQGHSGKSSCPHCMAVGERVVSEKCKGKTVVVDKFDADQNRLALLRYPEREYTNKPTCPTVLLELPGFNHHFFAFDVLHTAYSGAVKFQTKRTKLFDLRKEGKKRAELVNGIIGEIETPSWVCYLYL